MAKEGRKSNTLPNPTNSPQASSHAQGGIWVFTFNEIANGIMQLISVIAALIFGVWAIKSFDAALDANSLATNALQQTLIANQLALLSICASDQVSFLFVSSCDQY
jgi:hypothetical protein